MSDSGSNKPHNVSTIPTVYVRDNVFIRDGRWWYDNMTLPRCPVCGWKTKIQNGEVWCHTHGKLELSF